MAICRLILTISLSAKIKPSVCMTGSSTPPGCANTAILEIAPAYGPMHSEIIGDSFVMKDGYVFPPQKPGLGLIWNDKIKNKFPFVRGRGEFNSVPGKNLADYDNKE